MSGVSDLIAFGLINSTILHVGQLVFFHNIFKNENCYCFLTDEEVLETTISKFNENMGDNSNGQFNNMVRCTVVRDSRRAFGRCRAQNRDTEVADL